MENITLSKIISLFNSDTSDKELKEIYSLISNIKEVELDKLFGNDLNITKDSNNFLHASTIFNSLFLVLKNLNFFDSDEKKMIGDKIATISFNLYYSSYYSNKNIDHFIFLSLYGIISNNIVDIDNIIRENIIHYNFIDSISTISDLENNVKFIILKLLQRIKNQEDIDVIEKLVSKLDEQIEQVQENYILKRFSDIEAIEIIGYSNLLHLITMFSKYLVDGNTGESNLLSSIDIYSKNAIDSFKSSNNSLFVNISYLIKFSFTRIYELSIWTFLNSNQLFQNYFTSINSNNKKILSFFPSQRKAMVDLFNYGKKAVILTMPTSGGKSILAELYILFNLKISGITESKPLVVYIVPTNALLNQVKKDLTNKIGSLGYKIGKILPINSIDEYEKKDFDNIDVLVTTPEKLDFLIRNKEPIIERLGFVVMDEAHNIGDEGRGSKFELVLSTIKQERILNNRVNFLLLSPFVKNAKNIGEWLGDSIDKSTIINIDWSPTKQYTGNFLYGSKKNFLEYLPSPRGVLYNNKQIIFSDTTESIKSELKIAGLDDSSISKIYKVYMALKNLLNLETILVISESPSRAELIASTLLQLDYFNNDIDLDADKNIGIRNLIDLIKLEYDTEENNLIKVLKRGIVYHHAQMPDIVKKEIENLISEGYFKVVCSTTTLGQGMNFPIRTVVFDTLSPGKSGLMSPTVFWNIAGRAGRAFIDKDGHIIALQKGSQKESRQKLQDFINYDIKELLSSLTDFFNSLEESGYIIDYTLVRKNPTISNFLQYINHVIYNKYNYNFEKINQVEIRKILSSSLLYSQLSGKEGFEVGQTKINHFVNSYISYLKDRVIIDHKESQLKKADKLSISDISLSNVTGLAIGLKSDIGVHSTYDIILSRDNQKLSKIINILNSIPELKLGIGYEGEFDPILIAKIVDGWVNGNTVKSISDNTGLGLNECYRYINSKLRNYVTWGISIYQQINNESIESNNVLPSYIYYGVNNDKDLILSVCGVPRFALRMIKGIFKKNNVNIEFNIENVDILKNTILNFSIDNYSKESYKKIIDDNISNS